MAEKIEIPFDLSLQDIKLNNATDLRKLESSLSASMNNLTKRATKLLGNYDISNFDKNFAQTTNRFINNCSKMEKALIDVKTAGAELGSTSYSFKLANNKAMLNARSAIEGFNTQRDRVNPNSPYADKNLIAIKNRLESGKSVTATQKADFKEYEETLKAFEQMATKAFSSFPNPNDYISDASSKELQLYITKLLKFQETLNNATEAENEFNQAAQQNPFTQEYQDANKQLVKIISKITNLQGRYDKLVTTGKLTTSNAESLSYDANLLDEQLNEIVLNMKDMVREGKAFSLDPADSNEDIRKLIGMLQTVKAELASLGEETQNYGSSTEILDRIKELQSVKATLAQKLNNQQSDYTYEKRKLKDYRKNARHVYTAEDKATATAEYQKQLALVRNIEQTITNTNTEYEKTEATLKYLTSLLSIIKTLDPLIKNIRTSTNNAEIQRLNELLGESGLRLEEIYDESNLVKKSSFSWTSILKESLTNIDKLFTKVISDISNIVKKLRKSFKSLSKSSNSSNNDIKRLLKSFMQFGLGVRSLYFLIKQLRTVFTTAMKSMAAQIPEVNTSVSSFLTHLDKLKGGLGTAFQPIVSKVIPILNMFMDGIYKAMTAVGKFFATLTGQGYIYEYTAENIDYAQSLNDTSSAADNATKSLKDYLSPLDEISKFESDNDSGSGSGSGNNNSGNNNLLGGTYKKVDVVGSLWDALKNKDWESFGTQLADNFKAGLQKLYNVLDWDNGLGDKLTYWMDAFIKAFNSFVDELQGNNGFDLLGRVIGAGLNDVANIINKMFGWNGLDIKGFGTGIGTAINGLFDEVSWNNLGKAIGNFKMILWRFLYGAVTSIDFHKIGQAIVDGISGFFSSFSFSTISSTLASFINGIGTALSEISSNTDMWEDVVDNISTGITTFLSEFQWEENGKALGDFIKNLLTSLRNIIRSDKDGNGKSLAYDIGNKIGTFLSSMDWGNILQEAGKAIIEALGGLLWGLWQSGGTGKVIAALIVNHFVLKIAAALIGSTVGKALIESACKSLFTSAGTAAAEEAGATAGSGFIASLGSHIVSGIKGIGTKIAGVASSVGTTIASFFSEGGLAALGTIGAEAVAILAPIGIAAFANSKNFEVFDQAISEATSSLSDFNSALSDTDTSNDEQAIENLSTAYSNVGNGIETAKDKVNEYSKELYGTIRGLLQDTDGDIDISKENIIAKLEEIFNLSEEDATKVAENVANVATDSEKVITDALNTIANSTDDTSQAVLDAKSTLQSYGYTIDEFGNVTQDSAENVSSLSSMILQFMDREDTLTTKQSEINQAFTNAGYVLDTTTGKYIATGVAATNAATQISEASDSVQSDISETGNTVDSTYSETVAKVEEENANLTNSLTSGTKEITNAGVEQGTNYTTGYATGISDNADKVTDAASTMVNNASSNSVTMTDAQWRSSGSSGAQAYGDGFSAQAEYILNKIQQICISIINKFNTYKAKFKTAGVNDIKSFAMGIANTQTTVTNKVSSILTAMISTINNSQTSFKNAGQNCINSFINGFNGNTGTLVSLATNVGNTITGVFNTFTHNINSMLNATTSSINSVLSQLRNLAGKTGTGTASVTYRGVIPKLATGAVIPANHEFLAVLGDQKQGNNIETPENLLRKIVREESGTSGGTYEFVAKLNQKTIFDAVLSEAKLRKQQSGKNLLTSF